MTVSINYSPQISPHYTLGEIGAYSYGLGHPMKPQRMRITHELVMAYGMLDKLHVIVSLQLLMLKRSYVILDISDPGVVRQKT